MASPSVTKVTLADGASKLASTALTGAATATSETPAATRTVAKLATIFLNKVDLLGLEFSHENERALGACAGRVGGNAPGSWCWRKFRVGSSSAGFPVHRVHRNGDNRKFHPITGVEMRETPTSSRSGFRAVLLCSYSAAVRRRATNSPARPTKSSPPARVKPPPVASPV